VQPCKRTLQLPMSVGPMQAAAWHAVFAVAVQSASNRPGCAAASGLLCDMLYCHAEQVVQVR
jgi:hypothetical protein